MKKLLVTTALCVAGLASTASAQSVLERVLGKIDNSTNLASVNGTFANIAENIGSVATQTVYVADDGSTISQSTYDSQLASLASSNVNSIVYVADSDPDLAGNQPAWTYGGVEYASNDAAVTAARNAASSTLAAQYNPLQIGVTAGIDGSILNVVDGITDATQTATAGVVNAVEYNMPEMNWGDMSTTVLGAVNTGEITLGVNQSVEQAKTSSTAALSSAVDQLGGSADTGALVLNVASNMTGVNGSIRNTMTEVNGTVGDLGTTVLGAVNTGTITSGVNAAVTGIVGGTAQTGGTTN